MAPDEFSALLDEDGVRDVREILLEIKNGGVTVILSPPSCRRYQCVMR